MSTLIPEGHSGAEHVPDQQPSAVRCLEGGLTLKFTAYIPHLEAVKGGGTLLFPCFPEQGRRSGGGLVRPHLSEALLIVAEGLFSLQTRRFLPHPLAARPALINTGLIHSLCSPLQLDRWSMEAGTWECSRQQLPLFLFLFFFCGEM